MSSEVFGSSDLFWEHLARIFFVKPVVKVCPDPSRKVRTLQKVSFTYKKMILKIVVWNQLSSKKICRTSFEITVLSYITWRHLCWCLSALERARQENIFCMFVVYNNSRKKSSFRQKTPQKCNILTLLYVKQLCKV